MNTAEIHARWPNPATRWRKGCHCDDCHQALLAYHREWRRAGRRDQNEIDEFAVERAVMGDPPETTTRAEREEAVRRLHARGLTDRAVAARIGISGRTVLRTRQRLGLPTNNPGYRHPPSDRKATAA